MLSGAIHIIEFVLYIYFAVCVGYIVIFSVASCFFKSQQYPQSHDFKRFAILIPAYKEDNVILDCIQYGCIRVQIFGFSMCLYGFCALGYRFVQFV